MLSGNENRRSNLILQGRGLFGVERAGPNKSIGVVLPAVVCGLGVRRAEPDQLG
jgi:hypothetical protein